LECSIKSRGKFCGTITRREKPDFEQASALLERIRNDRQIQ
jgi:hypothetical protein